MIQLDDLWTVHRTHAVQICDEETKTTQGLKLSRTTEWPSGTNVGVGWVDAVPSATWWPVFTSDTQTSQGCEPRRPGPPCFP